VNSQTLLVVETFRYLGSTLSRDANINSEIKYRISKANSTFWETKSECLREERRGISHEIKLKVYRAVVLTTFLYGSET